MPEEFFDRLLQQIAQKCKNKEHYGKWITQNHEWLIQEGMIYHIIQQEYNDQEAEKLLVDKFLEINKMNESSRDYLSSKEYIEQTQKEYREKVYTICDILQEEMIKQALEYFQKNPLLEEKKMKDWEDVFLDNQIQDTWVNRYHQSNKNHQSS